MPQKQRQKPRKRPESPPGGERSKAPILYIAIVSVVVFSMMIAGLAAVDWSGLFPDTADPTPDYSADPVATQRAIVAQNPDDIDAKMSLASMMANSGRMNEAIPLFEEAIRLEPDEPKYRLDFAMALQTNGMSADAEVQFLQVLELDPDNHAAHYYLARLYLDSKPTRQDEAISHFERVIEIAPDSFLAEQATTVLNTIGPATPMEYEVTPLSSPTYAD